MNEFKKRPGLIYIAALVLVVCSIPLMREARRLHNMQDWAPGVERQQRLFQG